MPRGAELVRTYESFLSHVEAFDHGERNLLIVVGPPGTGKSTAAKTKLKHSRIIQGGSTPYRLYQELYENANHPIVLDDADPIWAEQRGRFLLKTLCQSDPEKTIQWNSNTMEIRSGELPSQFTTSSKVMIIANSWPDGNADVQAIESRGHMLYFVPTFREIHAFAASYFKDKEILRFIGANLNLFDEIDLRTYYKAAEIKQTSLRTGDKDGWKRYLMGQTLTGEKRVTYDLLASKDWKSDNARAKEFEKITGLSARTFYRYAEELRLRREAV